MTGLTVTQFCDCPSCKARRLREFNLIIARSFYKEFVLDSYDQQLMIDWRRELENATVDNFVS